MDEDEKWLQELKVGDRVHVYNRFAKNRPPLAIGEVRNIGHYSITVLVEKTSGLARYEFSKTSGAQVDTAIDHQAIASLGIRPYTEEQELARRERKEKSAVANNLRRVEWEDLPLDVLDSICATLRESGVNV